MAKMLGKAARMSRHTGYWHYCCPGHDGLWKDYVRYHKGPQRAKEKRQWQKEMIL